MRLTYDQGVDYMKRLCSEVIGKSKKSFRVHPRMEVVYPANKEPGDYFFLVDGKVYKHSKVCAMIVDYILNGVILYEECKALLEDVYANGTTNPEETPERQFLKDMLFWTTLQEEINYPQKSGFQGRLMSFYRYAEALAASAFDSDINLQTVMRRADDRNQRSFQLLNIPDVPIYYR